MRSAYTILYLVVTVVLGASADALDSTGVYTYGHLYNALEIGLLLAAWAAFNLRRRQVWLLVMVYAFFRFAFFDYTHNLVAGKPLVYMGGENWWDMFFAQFPPWGVAFARLIFLAAAVSLTIRYLRK